MKAVAVIAAFLGSLALLFVGLYYGGVFANKVQANYNKRVVTDKLKQQINQPDFMRVAYDHFYDLCASVQANEGSQDAQFQELESAAADDRTRIQANISGLRSARASSIAQYNADAHKTYTIGNFQAADLPWQLPTEPYNGKDKTTCAA